MALKRLTLTSKQFRSRAEGATFCQVKIIKRFLQESPSITWGSQKWKGAAAIFIKSLKKIKKERMERLVNLCWSVAAKRAEVNRIEEAKAWIKKYFNVASFSRGEEKFINNANTANILISSPTQAINQEEAEIAKTGPIKRRPKNKAFQGRINIQKGNYSIFGIWAQKLF